MNIAQSATNSQIDKIANAVLYEGYLLYPYRRCVKNHKRWMFGCVYPQEFCARQPAESCSMQTQCLLEANSDARLEVEVRFLHLLERQVARVGRSLENDQRDLGSAIDNLEFVDSLEIEGERHESWQEAVEQRIACAVRSIGELLSQPYRHPFNIPASETVEPLASAAGEHLGVIIRSQEAVQGGIEITAERTADEALCITVRIENTSPCGESCATSEQAQRHSLVSTHTILHAQDGRFVSLIDPPAELRHLTAGLKNQGSWPVLVGNEGQRDTMLCSPIILYDYPEVAAESPGDLFDATEIDEILMLRTMTLTDEEKRQMQGLDDRAGRILERTESLPDEQFRKLHGAIRGLKRLQPIEK